MKTPDVVRLLRSSDLDAAPACLRAIEQGANVGLPVGEPIAITELQTIFERRVRHLVSIGRGAAGGEHLIDALRTSTDAGLRLAFVNAQKPPMHFALFISSDTERLVACVAVDETDNPTWKRLSEGDHTEPRG